MSNDIFSGASAQVVNVVLGPESDKFLAKSIALSGGRCGSFTPIIRSCSLISHAAWDYTINVYVIIFKKLKYIGRIKNLVPKRKGENGQINGYIGTNSVYFAF